MIHALAAGLVAATAAVASAPSPFPLGDGSRWSLRELDRGAARTISVRGGVVRGLPGAGDLRVRGVGATVQAWDAGQQRWEALFRFGARAGTRYVVDLAGTGLWRSVVVTVAAKQAVVEDYDGRPRRGCIRFTMRARKPVADAGIEEVSFAPGVGPVRIIEQTIAGPRELLLDSYRLGT